MYLFDNLKNSGFKQLLSKLIISAKNHNLKNNLMVFKNRPGQQALTDIQK